MKNNKIFNLILIFLVTLFSFNLRVDAAQELTCLYKTEWFGDFEDKRILLIQYSDGNRVIFLNPDDVGIEGKGWKKTNLSTDSSKFDSGSISFDTDGSLMVCPSYANIAEDGVYFSESEGWWIFANFGKTGLDVTNSINGVNEPNEYVSVVQPKLLGGDPENSAETFCDSNSSWLIDFESDKYTAACLYKYPNDDGTCHYVQINYGKDLMQATEYDFGKQIFDSGVYYYHRQTTGFKYVGRFNIDKSFTSNELISITGGNCINAIKVYKNHVREDGSFVRYRKDTEISLFGSGDTYHLVAKKGKNPITGEDLNTETRVEILKTEIDNCADLFGEEIAGWFKFIWNFVKVFIPILLFALGCLDFAKAIFAGKEDEMKKAQSKFIKRVIIAVVIFMIPALLGFLLNVANSVWGNIGTDICGILS